MSEHREQQPGSARPASGKGRGGDDSTSSGSTQNAGDHSRGPAGLRGKSKAGGGQGGGGGRGGDGSTSGGGTPNAGDTGN